MAEAKLAERPVAATGAEVLTIQDLQAWYGESHILHGINFNVKAGEVVTLLGRNGAGKTTTLKSIMGVINKRSGSIRFDNKEIIRATSDKIARMGIAFCPEERGIFSSLDVRENLMLPPVVRPGGLPLDQIFTLFPNLKERLNSQGTKLSGGEQQMKSQGFTILLVEQNFRFASTVADRYYIVEHGKVIDGFANSELSANMDKLHTYLGV